MAVNKLFKAQIQLKPGGQWQEIKIEARDSFAAKDLIKAQYGGVKIISGPIEIRR